MEAAKDIVERSTIRLARCNKLGAETSLGRCDPGPILRPSSQSAETRARDVQREGHLGVCSDRSCLPSRGGEGVQEFDGGSRTFKSLERW